VSGFRGGVEGNSEHATYVKCAAVPILYCEYVECAAVPILYCEYVECAAVPILYCEYDARKSAHHHTIPINQPTRCNSFRSLLLDVYVWLNMFREPLRPSSGAYNCTRSLWFYRWSVAVGALLVVVWQVIPDDRRRGARNMLSHT